MPAPARPLLSDLPKGHTFPETALCISRDELARYLDAVGDPNALYLERRLAPPLAVAARALGSLLERMELPPGTLHTGQEVEMRAAIALDAPFTLRGRVAQRSERAGMVISVIEFEVAPEGGEAALAGRATVMVAGAAS